MEKIGPHFKDLLLGEMNYHEWLFSIIMVLLGALIYVYFRIINRKDQTTDFSFKIWFSDSDNLLAIPFSLALTYLTIRFYSNYQDYILNQLPEGFKTTPHFIMLVGGFCQHWVSEKLNYLSKKL